MVVAKQVKQPASCDRHQVPATANGAAGYLAAAVSLYSFSVVPTVLAVSRVLPSILKMAVLALLSIAGAQQVKAANQR